MPVDGAGGKNPFHLSWKEGFEIKGKEGHFQWHPKNLPSFLKNPLKVLDAIHEVGILIKEGGEFMISPLKDRVKTTSEKGTPASEIFSSVSEGKGKGKVVEDYAIENGLLYSPEVDERIQEARSLLAECSQVNFSENPEEITITSANLGIGDDYAWLKYQLDENTREGLTVDLKEDNHYINLPDGREKEKYKQDFEINKVKQLRDHKFIDFFKNNKSDLFILQEANDLERLQSWLEKAGVKDLYGIYACTSAREDEVILFNKDRFELSESQLKREENKLFTTAVLSDKKSDKKILGLSAHVTGFTEIFRNDDGQRETGDSDLKEFLEDISSFKGIVLFGGDLNDARRCEMLEAKGFQRDHSKLPTLKHRPVYGGPGNFERLDFTFAKNVESVTPLKNTLSLVDANGTDNPSDHLPVSSRVKI